MIFYLGIGKGINAVANGKINWINNCHGKTFLVKYSTEQMWSYNGFRAELYIESWAQIL